jgi:hypothetical protein
MPGDGRVTVSERRSIGSPGLVINCLPMERITEPNRHRASLTAGLQSAVKHGVIAHDCLTA